MDTMINYFQNIPSLDRALILAGGITIFWLIEYTVPLFRFKYNKWKHAAINIFFTLTTVIINFAFALWIVFASDWCLSHHFGVLQWIEMPVWLQLIAGLLLLDLVSAYLIHLIEHKVKWMWRFHIVHHADMHVDTTTANRHHPGESVFRAVFTVLSVYVAGAPIWLIMLYQSLSVVLSQFNHANMKFPKKLDKILSYIIVSPNMHKIHHHYQQPQTDSNYGNIFSIWDRLFGTFNFTPVEELTYGLDLIKKSHDDDLGAQLAIPFRKMDDL